MLKLCKSTMVKEKRECMIHFGGVQDVRKGLTEVIMYRMK